MDMSQELAMKVVTTQDSNIHDVKIHVVVSGCAYHIHTVSKTQS